MELHARRGRAVLVVDVDGTERDVNPESLALPGDLAAALHEWAQVVDAVRHAGDQLAGDAAGDLVTKRGRQLAGRLAAFTEVPVGYADPLRGEVVVVPVPAIRRPAGEVGRDERQPTPWATGLTVSAFAAVVVLFAIMTLSLGLADASRWLALGANIVVAGGLAPSVWLARHTPIWRWVAYGVVVGIVVAWFALILTLLES